MVNELMAFQVKISATGHDSTERGEKGDSHLVVDGTGVGAPVVDLFREGGLSPISVTITGGDATTHEGGNWHVPKRDLVGTLQVLFQTGRLKVAEELPEAQTLVNELMAFQVKISATGHDSYGAWREGSHDDLVLAAALACWYGKWGTPNIRWLYYPSDHEEEPGGMGKRV